MIEIESCESHQKENIFSNSFIRIDDKINYDSFFRDYMEANQPCLFGEYLTSDWGSTKEWVKKDSINYEYFKSFYGSYEVPIANCGKKHFNSQIKQDMKMRNYIDYFLSNKSNNSEEEEEECLYLKDWHFVREEPLQEMYITPLYFASDWLNEFWSFREDMTDDYRFVYLGPKGSWTPFHCDVFQSFSWSANICGKKRWLFYPPGTESFLKDKFGTLVYDCESQDLQDQQRYPNAKECPTPVEVIQKSGETVFVPSGWHHQVWNLEPTLSINHNWINATNIERVWTAILETLNEVEASISDCRSMDKWAEQCQLILKSTNGMDFTEYYQFIKFIASRRIEAVKRDENVVTLDGHHQGRHHTLYDLKKLRLSLMSLVNDNRVEEMGLFNNEQQHPSEMIDQIEDIIYNV